VLWIGYLQWHFRTRGAGLPPQPVLRDFKNIECRDAVLAYDRMEYVMDAHGIAVSRWDGKSMKQHPVTGEQVPDENARVPLERYLDPRCAEWPAADVVVGNPPFIGKGSIRAALGDGYTEALRSAWKDVPDSADFVMYWWQHAAQLVAYGKLSRFGFITTNSITQTFNRRVLERHLAGGDGDVPPPSGCEHIPPPGHPHPLHLAFAIADHPWVDSVDGAAVRIAMTVAAPGVGEGRLLAVTLEREGSGEGLDVVLAERTGAIHADLSIGANVAVTKPLLANAGISSNGFMLAGSGFIVTTEEASHLDADAPIKHYRNGRDLTDRPRDVMLIDLFGLSVEEVRARYPATFQWVLERVKPERDHNRDAAFRTNWWLFGRPRPALRQMVAGLPRYIATGETAKHRVFQFLEASVAPDHMLIAIALEEGYPLGVLSSHVHVAWALATGGRLGVGNDPRYNKSRCFETFPFPAATPAQQARIGELAEQLDAHRKRVLAEHAELTLTGLYNVLEKLRHGEPLSAKDKLIHEHGLVAVLQSLHDELDAAVLDAYTWNDRPDDATLLERLVALNAERHAEEAQGTIRWLRPEFQNPKSAQADMAGMEVFRPTICDSHEEVGIPPSPPAPKPQTAPQQWPQQLPDQVAAVARALATAAAPLTLEDLAAHFKGKGPWKKRLPQLLDTLVVLGKARVLEDGRWMG